MGWGPLQALESPQVQGGPQSSGQPVAATQSLQRGFWSCGLQARSLEKRSILALHNQQHCTIVKGGEVS